MNMHNREENADDKTANHQEHEIEPEPTEELADLQTATSTALYPVHLKPSIQPILFNIEENNDDNNRQGVSHQDVVNEVMSADESAGLLTEPLTALYYSDVLKPGSLPVPFSAGNCKSAVNTSYSTNSSPADSLASSYLDDLLNSSVEKEESSDDAADDEISNVASGNGIELELRPLVVEEIFESDDETSSQTSTQPGSTSSGDVVYMSDPDDEETFFTNNYHTLLQNFPSDWW